MSQQTMLTPGVVRAAQDYRLLMKSVEQAPFNDEGKELVRKSLAGNDFWQACTADEILGLATTAQQHGLLDTSLELLSWLNEHRPECEQGWQEHLELLHFLGRNSECAALLARLSRHLPAHRLAEWKQRFFMSDKPEDPQREPAVLDPFLKLRQDEANISLFMRLFRGREDVFARQWADREQEKQGYMPVQRPLSPEDVRDHLTGKRTYGIYLLTSDERVWTGVIDVDLVPRLRDREERKKQRDMVKREAIYLYKRVHERAAQHGLSCICEVSGGKGYHYWFPAQTPVAAGIMKKALQAVVHGLADDVNCFALEIFPKQEQLKGKGYGNLVKLPLGVHRVTGKKSGFIPVPIDKPEQQFAHLRAIDPTPEERFVQLADQHGKASVIIHPRQAQWARSYPELAVLASRCAPFGQIVSVLRSARELSLKEEKVLLGVLAHLPRGRLLLHHLFSSLPEYNRPLLDYKISRIRGSVLGCKRIHSLLEGRSGNLPCVFENTGYPHPLLHLPEYASDQQLPIAERAANLQDALLCLKTAIEQIQRFL